MFVPRKSIRLSPRNYHGCGCYFVTICCAHRLPLLLDASLFQKLITLLRAEADAAGFSVLAYCFMPDHLHLLVESRQQSCDLPRFVKSFKQKAGYAYRQRTGRQLWQSFFYDHILRREESSGLVAWYIWLNPVRVGICRAPQEYPFSGSFTLNWLFLVAPTRAWTPPWRRSV